MKTKCDFCQYFSGSSCMAKPNSHYCQEALDEFYAYINKNKQYERPVKSLYDKNRRRK